ncbi:rhodanese-like domain-containing protein [Nakamurella silvestris]|nr:rhodanese-like domain-containing protein [Nakamurella silvestris]
MQRPHPAAVALALALALCLSACAAGVSAPVLSPGSVTSAAPSAPTTEETSTVSRTVVDVRTPEEYTAGHLDGAVNISLAATDFRQRIDALPKDGNYMVYCRTGVRSAEATSIMKSAGFTDVTDGGAMQDAATVTGLAIVTGS